MQKFNYILKFAAGPLKGKSLVLVAQDYTLGRDEGNMVRLADKLVSKHHGRISRTADGLFISDLGSRNGTFLNGLKLQPNQAYPLHPNCEIEIGQSTITVEFDAIGGTQEGMEEETTYDLQPRHLERIDGDRGPEAQPRGTGKLGRTTIPFSIDSNRNLQAIYTLLNTVVGLTDRQALINETMNIIMSFIGPERGMLFLREDLKDEGATPSVVKQRKGKKKEDGAQISRTVINKVLAEGDSLLSTEIPSDARFSGSKSLVAMSINSIVCAPIKTKSKFHGLVYLDSTSPTLSFKQDDLELLTAFGAQLGILMENLQLIGDFQELFLGVIKTLVNIIETKDEYTRGHSERVTKISLAIGQVMGLGQKDTEILHVSALLHDIGKIAVPEEILKKPGSLTADEYAVIKKHPTIGTHLVKELKNFDEISKGILYHHERFDGHGYPTGTAGEEIPLTARIIAVADTFDAMTSDRPYRGRLDDKTAKDEICRNQGKQFDLKITNAFEEAFRVNLLPLPEARFPSLLQLRKLTVEP